MREYICPHCGRVRVAGNTNECPHCRRDDIFRPSGARNLGACMNCMPPLFVFLIVLRLSSR